MAWSGDQVSQRLRALAGGAQVGRSGLVVPGDHHLIRDLPTQYAEISLAMSENRVGHAAISRSHASSTRSGSVRTERAMNHEA